MSNQSNFPLWLETPIERELGRIGFSLSNSNALAQAVLRLSDYYIKNPMGKTPWSERWCQAAYLAYYFPLNFMRLTRVLGWGKEAGFFLGLGFGIDVGAGLGTVRAAFEAESIKLESWQGIETAGVARNLYERLLAQYPMSWIATPPPKTQCDGRTGIGGVLVTLSFALTEIGRLPRWISRHADAIMVVEPGTRADGRALLALRKELIKEGFFAWAPCLHQSACPLFERSARDWCHHRVDVLLPAWLIAVEEHLPIKNRDLALSYLLMRRDPPKPPNADEARVIGRPLFEKGRVRQLICRGEEREFAIWQLRHGEPEVFSSGERCRLPAEAKFGISRT